VPPGISSPSGEKKINVKTPDKIAPLQYSPENGRQTKIHYEEGSRHGFHPDCKISSGMQETPRIGPDNTPLVIHLSLQTIAQYKRQQTSPYSGKRLYPQVRRELMRRYQKHQVA